MRRAALWMSGAEILKDVLQAVMMIVMVRLLTDADYGKFALVASIVGFGAIFTSTTFIPYSLLPSPGEDDTLDDQHLVGFGLNIPVFCILLVVAEVLEAHPTYSEIAPLLRIGSLPILLSIATEIARHRLQRRFDWSRLAALSLGQAVLGHLVALGLALNGFGVKSLVWPLVIGPLPFLVEYGRNGVRLFPKRGWRQRLVPALRYGRTRIGSAFLGKLRPMVEAAALVAFVGYGDLGLMNRAVGLATVLCSNTAPRIVSVLFPILAQNRHDRIFLKSAYRRVVQLILWLALPIGIGLSLKPSDLVHTLYGAAWAGASVFIAPAMAVATASAVNSTCNQLLLATNQPRACLVADIIFAVSALAAVSMSSFIGLRAYLLLFALCHCLAAAFLLKRLQALHMVSIPLVLRDATVGVACSAIAAIVAVSLDWLGGFKAGPAWGRLAVWITSFALAYLVTLRLVRADDLKNIVASLPGRRALMSLLRYS